MIPAFPMPPPRPEPAAEADPSSLVRLARNIYFDRTHAVEAAKLRPGEYFATAREMVLVTVLGSSVAACIRDARTGVGGMTHFMLPDGESAGPCSRGERHGVNAMELLINHLLGLGAQHARLEAKVFGGGQAMMELAQAAAGRHNAEFVARFLDTESIPIAARDLAGEHPRKLYYFPATGRALVKRLWSLRNDTVAEREREYLSRLGRAPACGSVEWFE